MNLERLIILVGGPGAEADVSRSTGAGMARACAELGYAPEVWELDGAWVARLSALPRAGTVVLLGLHGVPGEDGTVQGVLESLGLPYQGSGVAASAVAMDKNLARAVLAQAGVPVAAGLANPSLAAANVFLATHGTVVVKPALGGSSVGVSVVRDAAALSAALTEAARHGPLTVQNSTVVEAFVAGQELTVGVLAGVNETRVLPIIEIVPQGAGQSGLAYDYAAKYAAGGSAHLIPANLPENITQRIQHVAMQAGCALGATGAYRVDVRYDASTEQLAVLEVNTLPGLTPTSLLPDAAAYVGLGYTHLVRWMLDDALLRRAPHQQT